MATHPSTQTNPSAPTSSGYDARLFAQLCRPFAKAKAFQKLSKFDESKTPYHEITPGLSLANRCEHCDALLWAAERQKRQTPCCQNGKFKNIEVPVWADMYDDQKNRNQYDECNPCTEEEFKADMEWYKQQFKSPMFADTSRQ
jgi:hypothetical protein